MEPAKFLGGFWEMTNLLGASVSLFLKCNVTVD